MSIARRRPVRSSVVRCSETSGGISVRAVSVAMWRVSPSRFLCALPRIAGACAGPDGRDLRRCPVTVERTAWRVIVDDDDGRVRTVATPAMAVARGLAVADLRPADGARRAARGV